MPQEPGAVFFYSPLQGTHPNQWRRQGKGVILGHPVQGVPKKSDTIEIISLFLIKPLLNARDYTPGNLMNLYLHLSILKRFRFVQIF